VAGSPERSARVSAVLLALAAVGFAGAPLLFDGSAADHRRQEREIEARMRKARAELDEARQSFEEARDLRLHLEMLALFEEQPSQERLDEMLSAFEASASTALDAAKTSGAYPLDQIVEHRQALEHFSTYEQFESLYRNCVGAAMKALEQGDASLGELEQRLSRVEVWRTRWLCIFLLVLGVALALDVFNRRALAESAKRDTVPPRPPSTAKSRPPSAGVPPEPPAG
jgi:hypothetical protein